MNYILLNPRDWFEKDNIELLFVDGLEGKLEEVVSIDAGNTECIADSKHYLLEADAENSFVFWFKCDETDAVSKTCELFINFNTQEPFYNKYKLNNQLIKPMLSYKGWKLYSITFKTPRSNEKVDVSFSLVIRNTQIMLMSAKEPDYYSDWKEEVIIEEPQVEDTTFDYSFGNDDDDSSSNRNGRSTIFSFMKDLKHFLGNITIEVKETNPIHKEDESEELEYLKDQLNDDLEDLSDTYDDLSDNLSDYEDRFNDLRDRLEDASADESELSYLSDILKLFNSVKKKISKVDINDLSRALLEVSDETDGEKFKSELSEVEDYLDDIENELDDIDDLLDELEEEIDRLEDNR